MFFPALAIEQPDQAVFGVIALSALVACALSLQVRQGDQSEGVVATGQSLFPATEIKQLHAGEIQRPVATKH